MANYKNEYSVVITTAAGYSVTADDSTAPGVGAGAWADLQSGSDIRIATATGSVFVPFHAVDHAVVTLNRVTVTPPTDPTCVTP